MGKKNTNKFYAIVGLSFGKGTTNKYLASVVLGIAKQFPEAQLILQKEVAYYYFLPVGHIISEHRQEGKYLDTFEVLSQAKEICGENKDIILICHPIHLDRAVYIARQLGLRPAQGVVPERDIPYDPKDSQIWCRNPYFYAIWELGAWLKIWLLNLIKPQPKSFL